METIGIIGLGVMGLPIARNLIQKSGCPLMGYDVNPARLRLLEEAGGQAAGSAGELFEKCTVAFTMMPTNELVDEMLSLGIERAREGTVLVDLSSSYPSLIREHQEAARTRGLGLMDAPVSGGEVGAQAGTLAMMCGGEDSVFERVAPLLKTFAPGVQHMGPLGAGYTTKLANQMIVGTEIALVAEALSYAEKAGIDPERFLEAVRHGAAGSAVLEIKGPKMISGDFTPSSTVKVHLKDQHNALRFAQEIGASAPLTALATAIMEREAREGDELRDVAVLIRRFREGAVD